MALFYAYKGRSITKDIVIKDGSGRTINAGDQDQIRAIIGREGKLNDDFSGAELVVASNASSVHGSTFTKNSPEYGENRLRLDQDDLALIPAGVYTLFISLMDSGDGWEWKEVSREVICIEES